MVVAQHRVVLINEYVTKGLGATSQKLATATQAQTKLGLATGKTTQSMSLMQVANRKLANSIKNKLIRAQNGVVKSNKGLLLSMTKMRWALVNVAMVVALVYGAFRLLLKPSIDLEKEMTKVKMTTGETSEAMMDLRIDLIKLSTILPGSALDLAKIATIAGQLGIKGKENILSFTATIAMMANVSGESAETLASQMAKISRAFDVPIEKAGNLASAMVNLFTSTAATIPEITSSLTRVGAAASALGVGVETVIAFQTTLIDAGMRAERAGTRMRRAFTQMATGAQDFAKFLGISVAKFRSDMEEDAEGTLLKVIEKLNEYENALERSGKATELFGRVGGFAIMTLSENYDSLEENLLNANDAFASQTELLEKNAIAANNASVQWGLLVDQLKGIVSNAPSIKGFIESLRISVEGFGLAGEEGIWWRFVPGLTELANVKAFRNEIEKVGEEIKSENAEAYAKAIEFIGEESLGTSQQLDHLRLVLSTLNEEIEEGEEDSEKLTEQTLGLMEAYDMYADVMTNLNENMGKNKEASKEWFDELEKVEEDIKILVTEGEKALQWIKQFFNAQKETSEATETLSDLTSKYRLRINELQRELRAVGLSLSKVKDEMSDTNKEIGNILSRRFKIRGISETDIGRLISQQELELKKARFATLGLGTAEEFLRNASLMTADAIDEQTASIEALNRATATGEDRYEAWKTTLSETIRALLINSQDIEKDVTEVVKRAQTELLGITRFDQTGGDQFTVMTDHLDALGLAQDIFFGEEKDNLNFSEQLREDRINGMNESADQAIANLANERERLEELLEQEEFWINRQEEIREEIDKNRMAIDEETEAWNRRNAAMNAGGGDGGGFFEGFGESGEGVGEASSVSASITQAPGKTRAQLEEETRQELLAGIKKTDTRAGAALRAEDTQPKFGTGSFGGGAGGSFGPFKLPTYGDFISRPGQPAQPFSSGDTIIGAKNPEGLSNKSTIININIPGYNQDPITLASEIKRELSSLV